MDEHKGVSHEWVFCSTRSARREVALRLVVVCAIVVVVVVGVHVEWKLHDPVLAVCCDDVIILVQGLRRLIPAIMFLWST